MKLNNFCIAIIAAGLTFLFVQNTLAIEKKVIKIECKDEGQGAWLGIQIKDLTRDMKKELDTSAHYGAVVDNVLDDTPAAKAGLEPGDVITKLNNKIIRRTDDLTKELAEYKPDDTVKIEYIRGKDTRTVDVVLTKKPDDSYKFLFRNPRILGTFYSNEKVLGMELIELDDNLAGYFKVKADAGLLVTSVSEGSPAGKSGILAGDIIVSINGQDISRKEDIDEILEDVDKGDQITVNAIRHGDKKAFKLKIEENPELLIKPYLKGLDALKDLNIEKDIIINKNEDAIRRYKEKMNSWKKEYEKEVEEMVKSEIEKSQFKTQIDMQALQQELIKVQKELEALQEKLNSR